MPNIYLSPSTQEYNLFVNGGTEEYYMNLIADAMAPYLNATGISFSRNTPDMTASSSIAASNAGNYDFHLALHSNAAPPALSGRIRGSDMYHAPNSQNGIRMANILVNRFKTIYPLPELVRARPTTSIGEVTRTRAPAVLMEIAYHDNVEDANWIKQNIQLIAKTTVQALAEYFYIRFVDPYVTRTGIVSITSGTLNIRKAPSLTAAVIGSARNGDVFEILSSYGDWYYIRNNNIEGYTYAKYIV